LKNELKSSKKSNDLISKELSIDKENYQNKRSRKNQLVDTQKRINSDISLINKKILDYKNSKKLILPLDKVLYNLNETLSRLESDKKSFLKKE
jgi:hypothetical protein